MEVIKFGERIKHLRSERKLTQKEFCAEFNKEENITTIDSVRNWEQGKCVPEFYTIKKICDFFGCDIGYLFGECDCKTYDTQYICDKTGLTENAIVILQALNGDSEVNKIISKLLERKDSETIQEIAVISEIIKEKAVLCLRQDKKSPEYLTNDVELSGLTFKCMQLFMSVIYDYCEEAKREEIEKWQTSGRLKGKRGSASRSQSQKDET